VAAAAAGTTNNCGGDTELIMSEMTAAAATESPVTVVVERKKPGPKPRSAMLVDADDGPPVRVRLKRGQYVGIGCPDPDNRMWTGEEANQDTGEEGHPYNDMGHGFTHDHPARCYWKDEHVMDREMGTRTTTEVFQDGEVIQLFPIPEHERELADSIKAKDKRFTFSRKEALKKARDWEKAGIVEILR
jgi:hypothetical protein